MSSQSDFTVMLATMSGDKLGGALIRLTPAGPSPAPSREERIQAARVELETDNADIQAARRVAGKMRADGAVQYEVWQAIARNPDLRQDAVVRQQAATEENYRNKLAADVERLAAAIDAVAALAPAAEPEYPTVTAAATAWLNGVCVDAAEYSPAVLFAVLRGAIARKEFPAVQRLRRLLVSWLEYKPPFQSALGVHAVLAEADAFLDTDAVLTGEAARAWVDEARADARLLVGELVKAHGKLEETYIQVGALARLFPPKGVPGQEHPAA